jgi:hypothetical protein
VKVSDLAELITAISGLVTALTGLVGAILVGRRISRRERHKAPRTLAVKLAAAAADGEITVDELREIAESEEDPT